MRSLTLYFSPFNFCFFVSLFFRPCRDSILGKVTRGVQARTMATEAQLKIRILGTQNISKITKSMKMVSAAKLRGDQTRLAAAIPFAVCAIIDMFIQFFFAASNATVLISHSHLHVYHVALD